VPPHWFLHSNRRKRFADRAGWIHRPPQPLPVAGRGRRPWPRSSSRISVECHGASGDAGSMANWKGSSPVNAMALPRDGLIQLSPPGAVFARGRRCRRCGRCPAPDATHGPRRPNARPAVAPISGRASGEGVLAQRSGPGESRSQPMDLRPELKLGDATLSFHSAPCAWAPPEIRLTPVQNLLITATTNGMTTPAAARFEAGARRML